MTKSRCYTVANRATKCGSHSRKLDAPRIAEKYASEWVATEIGQHSFKGNTAHSHALPVYLLFACTEICTRMQIACTCTATFCGVGTH
eukprot:6186451-Pleurochrysis_carterae.AAC.5